MYSLRVPNSFNRISCLSRGSIVFYRLTTQYKSYYSNIICNRYWFLVTMLTRFWDTNTEIGSLVNTFIWTTIQVNTHKERLNPLSGNSTTKHQCLLKIGYIPLRKLFLCVNELKSVSSEID